jgi:hypothetical protein
MASASTIQTRITEAETAYHALMTGSRVVEAGSPSGVRVTYGLADADKLRQYIDWLKTQLQMATVGNRKPIYFGITR